VLDEHLRSIELVWVRDIGAELPTLDDDALIHALARHGHSVLVTSDYHMLDDPAVLVALHLTRVTLFAIEKAGHDPLIATGVLLKDLLPALRKGSPPRTGVPDPPHRLASSPRVRPARPLRREPPDRAPGPHRPPSATGLTGRLRTEVLVLRGSPSVRESSGFHRTAPCVRIPRRVVPPMRSCGPPTLNQPP
jgi:hypothetical protein